MASVVIMKGADLIETTLTDDNGTYVITSALLKDSVYTISVSTTGLQQFKKTFIYPVIDPIRKIYLQEDKKTLKDVLIVSQKQLVARRTDRYIINVENSYLSNGSNGLEVLQRSPGLWINSDGSIRMKGNQPVMVMINDIVQRMSPDELAEYLKSLPSESISKIEVIHNPPAEYEAAGTGGIVHIILKKARKNGMNAGLNNTFRLQGNKYFINNGASVDYKANQFYLSANGSFSRDKNDSRAYSNISYPDKSIYNTDGTRANDNRRQFYRFGAGYDLAPGHFIGLQHSRVANQFLNTFQTSSFYKDDTSQVTGSAFTDWQRKPVFITTTFNYSWMTDSLGSKLKIIADHTHGNKTEMNVLTAFYNMQEEDLDYRIFTPIITNIYTLQADLLKILPNKMQYSAGIKFASTGKDNQFIREDNEGGLWVKDPLVSNHFRYKESLLMAYAAAEKTFHKVSVKLGIRAEETFSRGFSVTTGQRFKRNFLDIFPSFFLNHTLDLSKGNAWHISYSKRIERPGFRELNPYRLQFDNHTVMLGNPQLLPQYTHAIEAGFDWRNKYTAGIYYSLTNNIIGQLAAPVAGNIIEYQYQNLDKSKEYGINIMAPVKPLKNWNIVNNFAAYQSAFTINNIQFRQSTWAMKSSHSIVFKKVADLDIIAEYRSKYVNANTIYAALFYCDVSISKKIWKNKGRLRLYCSDISNTAREKEITNYAGTHIFFYQKRQTRNLSISFNYNFSAGKKFSNKKIEAGASDR